MRTVPTENLDAVLSVLMRFPGGATLDDILANLSAPPSGRTLQRWLAVLIEQNRVALEGQSTTTRYRAKAPPGQPKAATPTPARQDSTVGITVDSAVTSPAHAASATEPPSAIDVSQSVAPAPSRPAVRRFSAGIPGINDDEIIALIQQIVRGRMRRLAALTFVNQQAVGRPNPSAFVMAMQSGLRLIDVTTAAQFGLTVDEYQAFEAAWFG